VSTRLPPIELPAERRLAVRVSPDALRQVRAGHPWIYATSVRSASHDGRPGDFAVVFDDRRRFAAIGLWDPTSPIRVRILHAGAPTPIDEGWWMTAIDTAVAQRSALEAAADTDAYRLIHGENDGLPGLVVDRYDSSLVLKLYSAAWLAHLPALLPLLITRLAPTRVVLRLARSVMPTAPVGLADGSTVYGPVSDAPVPFLEHGLSFAADLAHGHKTGHFLDQRDNRHRIGRLAAGCAVLDVFSCNGGFSVHAAAGGARSVHLIDRSAPALSAARSHLGANGLTDVAVTTTVDDAFAALEAIDTTHDVVVVDPPSFTSTRRHLDRALSAHRRLTRLAIPTVKPGGLLLHASCSALVGEADLEEAVRLGAAPTGRSIEIVDRFDQPVDHPVGFPQGRYLNALLLRIE